MIRVDSSKKTNSVDPNPLSERFLNVLSSDALSWCSLHGLVVADRRVEGSGSHPGTGLVHAPVSLLPSPFPKELFLRALNLAPIFNELVDKVSCDAEFLQETLKSVEGSDAFTAGLLKLHRTVLSEGIEQPIRLGMHRSDYMVNTEGGAGAAGGGGGGGPVPSSLKQVELNTISSSFAGLSPLVTELHRHIIRTQSELSLRGDGLPDNESAAAFAQVLGLAWREFGDDEACVLMVVQSPEHNMYDQHHLATRLQILGLGSQEKESGRTQRHKPIRVLRRTLAQVEEEGKLTVDGRLVIAGLTVAVVYFRAGYSPDDYPTQKEWDARLLLERSSAIKCPSVSYHLTGTKKVQQELAGPGVLERFLSAESAALVRVSFAGLWSLEGGGGGEAAVAEAMRNPGGFVLKPQREGGGNNIYGEDIRTTLKKLQFEEEEVLSAPLMREASLLSIGSTSDGSPSAMALGASDNSSSSSTNGVNSSKSAAASGRSAFVLMERLFPPVHRTVLLRNGEWTEADTLAELGVYGAYLRNGASVLVNKAAGHLLRTKTATSDEGGVAAGFAVLDSPYLTD